MQEAEGEAPPPAPLVEVEGLTIRFGATEAVRDVDLAIRPGERFGLIGESGSGKSLTALAIAGLLPPAARMSGTVRFAGAPLPTDEREMARLRGKRIGMVFQEPMTALNPLMKAGGQIGEALALSGLDAAPGRVAALFEEVGLDPALGARYPHQLSGGQRQRVMIAIAVASSPELIVADEPTSALDLITQARVLALLDAICARRGAALLFISHDLKAVAALCPRIAVLEAGVLVETGPTAGVLAAPRHRYTHRLLAAARIDVRPLAAPVTRGTILDVTGVSRHFQAPGGLPWRDRAPVVALRDVSFDIGESEAVAVVGPSGCGKTTLARIVVGLDRPTAGTLSLAGRRYGADVPFPRALRRDVSLVFQDPYGSLDPRMRIGDTIAEPLRLMPELPRRDRRALVAEALDAVGLDPALAARYPHEFSGGQRQRIAIARALVTKPRIVVLDEPVSALDVSVRGEVLALLGRLRADYGIAYLIISHDLDMVRVVADRVLVMQAGEIVEAGRPAALFADPRHEMTQALLAARLPAVGERVASSE